MGILNAILIPSEWSWHFTLACQCSRRNNLPPFPPLTDPLFGLGILKDSIMTLIIYCRYFYLENRHWKWRSRNSEVRTPWPQRCMCLSVWACVILLVEEGPQYCCWGNFRDACKVTGSRLAPAQARTGLRGISRSLLTCHSWFTCGMSLTISGWVRHL